MRLDQDLNRVFLSPVTSVEILSAPRVGLRPGDTQTEVQEVRDQHAAFS